MVGMDEEKREKTAGGNIDTVRRVEFCGTYDTIK